MQARNLRCFSLALALALPMPGFAGDGAVKPVVWSPHGDGVGCHMNMGPTGARAWMRGYRLQVMTVDTGSPADGVLRPGDLVIGVGDVTFSAEADSRMTLGDAIGRAEAADGALKLTIQRDGLEQRVNVMLPAIGRYAATWPYGCAKSQRVLHDACSYLREAQFPEGTVVTDGGMGTFLSGLLWLASGDVRFMDAARRAAYATTAMDIEKMETHNWPMGYGGLLLAEYYLATGDETVLPKLKSIADHLAMGQMRCGSWGHSGPSAGYGAMNQAGIVCAITLTLAQECGVAVDGEALRRALSFYGRYAELGAVPYGDHMPGTSAPDDNGKSASSAVLCSLQPDGQAQASVFAASVAMSYWMRETGHTGGFFSLVWGPLAARMADATPFQTFMDCQSWYYNLCRTWRGALVMLPYHEALTRFDDSTYNAFGGEFTTGGMALVYALPQRGLRILGAPRSVFGASLSGPLLQARQAYLANDAGAFDRAVAAARGAVRSDEQVRWLAQIEAAAAMRQATTEQTRREIENNLVEGDAYRASEQYVALRRFLGDDDATVVELGKRFEDGTAQWHVRAGGTYYGAWSSVRSFAFQTWLPYAATAKPLVGEVPPLRPPLWEALAPVAGETSREWRPFGGGVAGQSTFRLDTTDFAALRVQLRSPRNAHTQVQLNGTMVADVVRGRRSGYARIDLDSSALALLKEGTNLLAVTSTSVGSGGNALDVGLDGVLRERPQAPPPARTVGLDQEVTSKQGERLTAVLERARAACATTPLGFRADPAVPERMGVRDSMDRFKSALEAACDAMDDDELRAALHSPVAYWRYLASQTLARRGSAGLVRAAAGFDDEDWRVRSACCDALAAISRGAAEADEAVRARLADPALLSRLTGLVGDDDAWVRCRAAAALGAIGKADEAAAAALAGAVIDPDAWVRSAALAAIDKVGTDPLAVVKAAAEALQVPSTSFDQLGTALRLMDKHGLDDPSLVPALVTAIEHPGEGMGAQILNTALVKLVALDPDGTKAVPTLARVAAGGYAYDRLRGNPRKTAIDLLGQMGQRAKAALPTLKAIAAGIEEKELSLREAAQTAIGLIEG